MKDFKIYLSVAAAFLIIYLVAQYNKPAAINWAPTLYYQDKIPFGTYIVHRQLNHVLPGTRVVKTNASLYRTLHDSSLAAGNYIIIARSVNLSHNDVNELFKYVRAGSNVFISCFNIKGILADTLKLSIAYEFTKGNAGLKFANKQLDTGRAYTFKRDISNQYFKDLDTARATVIGKNSYGHATFLSYKFGKGSIYLCANPEVFSNYALLSDGGADYAAKALSYLPPAKITFWDQFQNGDVNDEESPLRVFFSYPNLQWAYYLSLAGILIFVLFEIKRRQRVIPVIEPLKNATLEFVNVVGQVYYEKRNNANMAHKKILYLMAHLRDEYQLKTNVPDNELIQKLIDKLGVEPGLARELINHINYIGAQQHVTDHELIVLNQLIEKIHNPSE